MGDLPKTGNIYLKTEISIYLYQLKNLYMLTQEVHKIKIKFTLAAKLQMLQFM